MNANRSSGQMGAAPAFAAGARGRKGGLLGALKARLSFRPLTYGYANARVHGLVSEFLPKDKVKALVAANTVDAIVEMLEHTSYKDDLVALSLRFKREELVELALGRQFARFAAKLLKITPKEAQGVLRALLARWDVHNVKTIILARAQGKKYDDVAPYLVLAGRLGEKDLRALSNAAGGEAFYPALRATGFGAEFISQASADIRKKMGAPVGERAAIESVTAALDAYVYRLAEQSVPAGDRDAKVVRRLLAREADAKNLSTLLRLMRSQKEGARLEPKTLAAYLVDGGTVARREWLELAGQAGVEEVAARLQRRLGLSAAMDEYKKDSSLSAFEIAMATANAKEGLATFQRAGLGLGVIVGALLLKENEMNNIRKIVRAKALGLPEQEIEKMMVSVR
ncbi:MAG: V-type ATPase subunit [Candidatus Micrarchaeota archaeon]|nr:V-type ATPase subunit [Candidatus Micrarchaeota archaeon]